jgi:hydroxybutyrate-dimer hydrolase
MYAKLKYGDNLPASQVIRTTPRGGSAGAAPAIQPSNVPAYPATPAGADAITLSGSGITVPN